MENGVPYHCNYICKITQTIYIIRFCEVNQLLQGVNLQKGGGFSRAIRAFKVIVRNQPSFGSPHTPKDFDPCWAIFKIKQNIKMYR